MDLKGKCKYLVLAAAALLLGCRGGSIGRGAIINPDVRVEVANPESLMLRVSLYSRAATPVTLNKALLPWGNKNSLMLEAVTDGDHFVTRKVPINPGVEQVTMNPHQWVSGDINLQEYFDDLDVAVKKSDVHLFWAFEAPPELNIALRSSGSVIIPRQK